MKYPMLILAVFLISIVSAQIQVGVSGDKPHVNFEQPVVSGITNASILDVNNSIYWDGHAFVYGSISSIESDPFYFSNPYNYLNRTTLGSLLSYHIISMNSSDTIQGTINSITDSSCTNRYLIIIPPKSFTEQVTLKEGISIKGAGVDRTFISNVGNLVNKYATIFPHNCTTISEMTIIATGTGMGVGTFDRMDLAGTQARIENVKMNVTADCVYNNVPNANFYIENLEATTEYDCLVNLDGNVGDLEEARSIYVDGCDITLNTRADITGSAFRNDIANSYLLARDCYIHGTMNNLGFLNTVVSPSSGQMDLFDVNINVTSPNDIVGIAGGSVGVINMFGGSSVVNGAGTRVFDIYDDGLETTNIYGTYYRTSSGTINGNWRVPQNLTATKIYEGTSRVCTATNRFCSTASVKGSDQQIAFFNGTNNLTGSRKLLWNNDTGQFTLNRNTADAGAPTIAGTAIRVNCADNEVCRIASTSYGIGAVTSFSGRTSRGTGATPTATQVNDLLTQFDAYGRGATGWSLTPRALVKIVASESYSDTVQGARLEFWTTPNGTIVPIQQWRIENNGNLLSDADGTKANNITTGGTVKALRFIGNGSQLTDVCLSNGTNCGLSGMNYTNIALINQSNNFNGTQYINFTSTSLTFQEKSFSSLGIVFPEILGWTGIQQATSLVGGVYLRADDAENNPLMYFINSTGGNAGFFEYIPNGASAGDISWNPIASTNLFTFNNILRMSTTNPITFRANNNFINSPSSNQLRISSPTIHINTTKILNITSNLTQINSNTTIAGEVIPLITNTYSLGSSTLRWLKGWFIDLDVAGNINTGSITTSDGVNITGNLIILGNLSVKRPYWVGYDNSTQNFINTANAQVINISNNGDYDSWQINVTRNQNLTFQQTGDYICILSPEFTNTASTAQIAFWFQKNGVDVLWSNSRYSIGNGEYLAPSITYQFDIHNPATDNIRFMWYSTSTNSQIISSGVLTSPTRPSFPGILLNCQKVSELTP